MSEFNKKSKDKSKSTIRQQLFEIGKLPPQAVDLEEAVLGACMLDKDSLPVIMDILQPACFYKEAHTRIFQAIIALSKKGEAVDILTVTHQLKDTKELDLIGGAYYVTQLTNRVASSANAEYHARIILQKFIQRELIRVSTETIKQCYEDNGDVFDILDKTESEILNVISESIKAPVKNTTAIYTELTERLDKVSKNTEELTGVPTGLSALNKATNGWQNGDLIIVAARPSMGKSALIKPFSKGCIEKKKPVLIFSLEMSTLQQATRFISEDVSVNSDAFKTSHFLNATSFPQINEAIRKYYSPTDINEGLLYIDDTPALKINELRARAKLLHRKYGIGLMIVDYLQLIDSSDERGGNREQEISKISRGLKTLARELDIPIIAFSQLSRAVEMQPDKNRRPNLSHLRESGAIEQDADVVVFLFRPEYYLAVNGSERDEHFATVTLKNGEIMSSEGFAELIIAKNRNGALVTVPARFTAHLTKFSDWDTQEQYKQPVANPEQFTTPKKEDGFEEPPF